MRTKHAKNSQFGWRHHRAGEYVLKRLLLLPHFEAGSDFHLSTMTTTTALAAPASPEPVIDLRKIPDWLLTHPELRKRGIILHKPLQPVSTPQATPKYSLESPR